MTVLDRLYQGCNILAAFFLAFIACMILAQIVARILGMQIPSADDFAAWSMAAAAFLALPGTLRSGTHIRVTLLLSAVPTGVRKLLDIVSTIVACGIMGWAAWYAGTHVWGSYTYGDLSQGIIAVPLWIPQLAMLIGITLMEIAFIERFVRLVLSLPQPEDQTEEG